jgi:hypothetical protein
MHHFKQYGGGLCGESVMHPYPGEQSLEVVQVAPWPPLGGDAIAMHSVPVSLGVRAHPSQLFVVHPPHALGLSRAHVAVPPLLEPELPASLPPPLPEPDVELPSATSTRASEIPASLPFW